MTPDAAVEMTKRTSYLELFFDLVFVFAITQVANALQANHSGAGWARVGLGLWLVWWAWSQFTWAGNAIDLQRTPVRLAMLAVTGLTLVAALAIPHAFDDRGAWFALPYAAVRLGGLALYWAGLRHDPDYLAALRTYVPLASISPLVVVVGGFTSDGVRPWPIVTGVVVFSVGAEEAILHPDQPLASFGRLAMVVGLVGLVVFLVGFVAGNARATHTLLVERSVAAVAVIAIGGLLAPNVSALSVVATIAAVMIATTVIETVRRR